MIGALRTRLTLLKPAETLDAAGGVAVSYEQDAVVWADVRPPRGRADVVADSVVARITQIARIRFRADIDARWRASIGGRAFRILAALDPDARGVWLDLSLEEEA